MQEIMHPQSVKVCISHISELQGEGVVIPIDQVILHEPCSRIVDLSVRSIVIPHFTGIHGYIVCGIINDPIASAFVFTVNHNLETTTFASPETNLTFQPPLVRCN